MSWNQQTTGSSSKKCDFFYTILKRTICTRSKASGTEGTDECWQSFFAGNASRPIV